MMRRTSFFIPAVRALCAIVLASVGGQAVFAASFDCAKARTYPERAICADPALSAADDRMLGIYTAARDAQGNSPAFRALASSNLKRLGACRDKSCIRAWLIDTAHQYEGLSGASRRGPSFNCAKARTYPERTICSNPALAAADRRMAVLYAQARDAQGDSPTFRALASSNLKRMAACRSVACLQAWYIETAHVYEELVGY